MHAEFGAKYLIGLPLWRADSADLAKKMMATAEAALPAAALVGFELGNEPEFWLSGVGGYDPKNGNKFVPGFEAYNQHFNRAALKINPCKDGRAKLSGPGWGNVNTIDAKWFQQHANMPDAKCYLRELTVHVSAAFVVSLCVVVGWIGGDARCAGGDGVVAGGCVVIMMCDER